MDYRLVNWAQALDAWGCGTHRGKRLADRLSLDKLQTYNWIATHTNLRAPHVYFQGGGPQALLEQCLAANIQELVIKPVNGSRGDGVRALQRTSTYPNLWKDNLNNALTTPTIVNLLLEETQDRQITQWFTEELIHPHPSQLPLLPLPLTAMTLRYWFYDGIFIAGVWMTPHSASQGKVTFQRGVHWGYFNYDGIMVPLCGQDFISQNDCIVNGVDFSGTQIVGAGNGIIDFLEQIARLWKPGGTLRIDGFVDQSGEWVFGEIETIQRAPTVSGNARHMRHLKGLGKPR